MMGFRGAGPARSVFVAVFVVGMLAAGLYAAQSSTKPTGAISVQQILDKNLAAMGGLEKLRETKTLEVGGSFGLNPYHSSGDFGFIFKAPTSDLFRLDYVSHGQTMTILHNGKLFTKQSGGKAFAMNGITDGVMEEAWRHLIEPNVDGYLSVTDGAGTDSGQVGVRSAICSAQRRFPHSLLRRGELPGHANRNGPKAEVNGRRGRQRIQSLC